MPEDVSKYIPQAARDSARARRARAAWGAALAVAALLVGAIVAAPLLRARGAVFLSAALYGGFRAACHQMPERSFYAAGFPLAVCARCFGLYAGALLGLALYPLARPLVRTDAPPRAWLFLAAVPTSVDFALGVLGVWENTHWSRFLTAALLGGAAAFYVMPGAADLALRYWPRRGRALVAVRPSPGG